MWSTSARFQTPGHLVGNENGAEPGGQSGIDVAFGRVADHPGPLGIEPELGNQLTVGGLVLFRHDALMPKQVPNA